MPTATSLAELESRDLDDLDPGLAHPGYREGVPLVRDHHTGLEGDDIVAVVPLLTLLLVPVAPRLDDVELPDSEGV